MILGDRTHDYIYHPLTEDVHFLYRGHAEAWQNALHVLSYVSPDHLHKVSIDLSGLISDPHSLDWDRFKAWCSRVPQLKRIDVDIEQAYDRRQCFAYEMQGLEEIFVPQYLLPVRKSITDSSEPSDSLIDSEVDECQHQGCCVYSNRGIAVVSGL